MYRVLREDYGLFIRLFELTSRNIVQLFDETRSIGDRVSNVHHCGVCSDENIAALSENMAADM